MTNLNKILLLLLLLIIAICFSIIKSSVDIPLNQLFSAINQPILQLRISRVITAIIVGAGLGVCGVALQAILRNPLAEPYLLGTSSAAGLGAIIGVLCGLSYVYYPLTAFTTAILSIALVYTFARESGKIAVQSLILSGVIVGITLSALIVFLVSISSNGAIGGMMWWLLGSLQVYNVKLLAIVATITIVGIILIYFFAQDLNAISIGEEEAIHLGINTETIKKILFILTSLITAALVSLSGTIGFVGLITPHIMRLIVGPNHRILIPATCIGSAAFLVLCDTLAKSCFAPVEIPIGVITSIIGAPIFIILLKRKQSVK